MSDGYKRDAALTAIMMLSVFAWGIVVGLALR